MSKANPFHFCINFDTGETNFVEETHDERHTRLRRESQKRHRDAFADKSIKKERITALSKAWQVAYGGKLFPVHYDLILRSGSRTKIERYTLLYAAFCDLVHEAEGELVGNVKASTIKPRRHASILADVAHEARIR